MTVAGQDRAGDDHFLDLVGTLEDAVSLDVAVVKKNLLPVYWQRTYILNKCLK